MRTKCGVSWFYGNLFIAAPVGSTHSMLECQHCRIHYCIYQLQLQFSSYLPSLQIEPRSVLRKSERPALSLSQRRSVQHDCKLSNFSDLAPKARQLVNSRHYSLLQFSRRHNNSIVIVSLNGCLISASLNFDLPLRNF